MLEYLDSEFDYRDPETVSFLDDLPLWSAPFGLLLLEQLKFRPHMTVLDIGFGTGFPLLELAQRLGDKTTVYGIDSCKAAVEHVRQKAGVCGIKNVELAAGDAAAMNFNSNMFDLIVTNLGINNFENPRAVFAECFRVAKPHAHIALTTNPKGHMREFYRVFADSLKTLKMNHLLDRLQAHIGHRFTVAAIRRMLKDAGFHIFRTRKSSFKMRFIDGSAFLNHYLIRSGFFFAWKDIVPHEDLVRVFTHLEESLNRLAERQGELKIHIPIAYIEGKKPAPGRSK